MKFEAGKVYLVKGKITLLWWVIRQLPNPQILWKATPETMHSHLEYGSFLEDAPITYVVFPDKPARIPSQLAIPPNQFTFIVLSDFDGELSKEAEKAYKALAGGRYEQVDLSRLNIEKDPTIHAALAPYGDLGVQLLMDLPNPHRLLFQLRQPDLEDYDVLDASETEVRALIKMLGKRESLERWTNLPRRLVYGGFITPDPTSCVAFAVLATGSRKFKEYALCPALWVYLEMFYTLLPYYKERPDYLLKLFATWVYLCTNVWTTRSRKGFTSNVYKGKTYWSFEPSPAAHAALMKLLRGSTPHLCVKS